MPTYEYQCEACQHAFEAFQPMSAAPIKKCPECGKNKVRRLIGAGAGLIFKGSGFYITDYRDGGYKEQAKADSAAGATGDAKPSTDAKGGDGKSSDGKSGESKPAETKAAEAKPAATKESAPAPKAESKTSSSASKKKSK